MGKTKKISVENQYKSSNIQILEIPERTEKMEEIINGVIQDLSGTKEQDVKDSKGLTHIQHNK